MAMRPLSPDLEEVALKELNEDPARREQDLKHLRDWLSKQPHLIARQDSQFLLMFLRGCKFSLERTKEKLDMFYTLRTALPEFFVNRDPKLPEIQYILSTGTLIPLPEPDDQGRRVILMRNGLIDFEKAKITDLMKVNLMMMDIMLEEDDRSIICGTVNVMDHKDTKLSDLSHYSPALMKKATTLFQDGYPVRPKAMHHVHMMPAFVTIFNLFKSFMKEKLKRRVYLHSDMDSVLEQVPKRVLPQEYGGDAGPLDKITADWKKKVEGYRTWFKEQEKYRSDEKKRPGKAKTQEDLFGLEGSFRQLNVD